MHNSLYLSHTQNLRKIYSKISEKYDSKTFCLLILCSQTQYWIHLISYPKKCWHFAWKVKIILLRYSFMFNPTRKMVSRHVISQKVSLWASFLHHMILVAWPASPLKIRKVLIKCPIEKSRFLEDGSTDFHEIWSPRRIWVACRVHKLWPNSGLRDLRNPLQDILARNLTFGKRTPPFPTRPMGKSRPKTAFPWVLFIPPVIYSSRRP